MEDEVASQRWAAVCARHLRGLLSGGLAGANLYLTNIARGLGGARGFLSARDSLQLVLLELSRQGDLRYAPHFLGFAPAAPPIVNVYRLIGLRYIPRYSLTQCRRNLIRRQDVPLRACG